MNALLVVRQGSPVKLRLCLACTAVNDNLVTEHFELEGLAARRHQFREATHMKSLDLEKGYWHLKVDRRYRRVPPVPDVPVTDGSARPRSSRRPWKKGEKLSTLVDPGILQRGEVDGRDRSALQEELDAFFQVWCLSGTRVTRKMDSVATDGTRSLACPFPRWLSPQRNGRRNL